MNSPNLEYNLFSLTKRLNKGYIIGGYWCSIWISEGDEKIVFDIKILMPKGVIFAAYFKKMLWDNGEVAVAGTEKKKMTNGNMVHGLVGHMNNTSGRKTMKYLGYDIA